MPVWGVGQPIVVILAVSLSRDCSWKSFKLPARQSESGIYGVDRSLPKASQWDGFVIRQRFASGVGRNSDCQSRLQRKWPRGTSGQFHQDRVPRATAFGSFCELRLTSFLAESLAVPLG
jgi:hypothetical protein